jgi:thiosulfate dehydrogenase [quinone] large subunit
MGWGRLPPELRSASVPALALLPLRIFFGVTFLYAGLDKLLDPAFFDANSPTSIQSQFQIFERVSPLAPLVHAAEPFAAALGILIALGEVAVGIGTLTGLAFRLGALGGAAI